MNRCNWSWWLKPSLGYLRSLFTGRSRKNPNLYSRSCCPISRRLNHQYSCMFAAAIRSGLQTVPPSRVRPSKETDVHHPKPRIRLSCPEAYGSEKNITAIKRHSLLKHVHSSPSHAHSILYDVDATQATTTITTLAKQADSLPISHSLPIKICMIRSMRAERVETRRVYQTPNPSRRFLSFPHVRLVSPIERNPTCIRQ